MIPPPFIDEQIWRSQGQATMCDDCPAVAEAKDATPCPYWLKGLPCPTEKAVHA